MDFSSHSPHCSLPVRLTIWRKVQSIVPFLMSKFLTRWYDTLMGPLEKRGFQTIRKDLLGKARGSVLEIGSGTGVNFPYYINVGEVIAIEPEPTMRGKSLLRAQQAPVSIDVRDGQAESLPFPDNRFDTVVGTLVLCTIPDPIKALEEIRRVCKPNGQVLFFEHVRINNSVLGILQDKLTPIWKRLCDGCHLNRNSLELMKKSGFKVTRVERLYKKIFVIVEAVNRK
jgi:ubiquinone/menaquinone biosynthesis C-methylase UbiE